MIDYGKILFKSLLEIIKKFRQRSAAFSSYIKQMFPQENIRKEAQSAQRFLLREKSETASMQAHHMQHNMSIIGVV